MKIIQTVAADWEELAFMLQFSDSKIEKLRERDKCCEEMFHRWLEGKACQEVTWERLIEALGDMGESTLAETIQQLLHKP